MKAWVPISELAGPCIVYCVQQIDSKYISRENLHRWSDEELEPLQGCHIRSWQHLCQEHLLPWLSNRPKVLQPHLGKHPGFGSLTKEFLLRRLVGGDLCRDGFQVLGQLHVTWMEILEGTEATVLKILHAGDHVTNTALLMRLNLFMRSWQTECQYHSGSGSISGLAVWSWKSRQVDYKEHWMITLHTAGVTLENKISSNRMTETVSLSKFISTYSFQHDCTIHALIHTCAVHMYEWERGLSAIMSNENPHAGWPKSADGKSRFHWWDELWANYKIRRWTTRKGSELCE